MAQTVMKLKEIWLQEIDPCNFSIIQNDCPKRNVKQSNYFNLGYFALLQGGKTIPVGNLANGGVIMAQAKDNEDWLNLAKKKLTTIYTTKDGKCDMIITDRLDNINNLDTAISGVPIIRNGKLVTMNEIKLEGYFGSEMYDTWHGFLGIRHGKLVYVAIKCGFSEMVWNLVALGIYNAIKLDGGGSFILHNDKELLGTSGNRIINNIGVWE